jgi:hypothetical protein
LRTSLATGNKAVSLLSTASRNPKEVAFLFGFDTLLLIKNQLLCVSVTAAFSDPQE